MRLPEKELWSVFESMLNSNPLPLFAMTLGPKVKSDSGDRIFL